MKKILLLLAIAFSLEAAETFHEDFEGTGSDSTWDHGYTLMSSTSSYDLDAAHSGTPPTGGGEQCCRIQGTDNGAAIAKTAALSPYTTVVFRVNEINATGDVMIYRLAQNSGSSTVTVYARTLTSPTNTFRIWCTYRSNNTMTTSTYDTLTKDEWHKLDIRYDSISTNFTYRTDESIVQSVSLTGTLRSIRYYQLGVDSLTNVTNDYDTDIEFDNILGDNADWPTISTESFAEASGTIASGFSVKHKAFMDYYYNPFAISPLTAGAIDWHYCMGVRRSVRNGTTVLQLAEFTSPAAATERTFRSSENGDNGTWVAIDSNATKSGCLVIDEQDTVYHFFLKYPYDTLCFAKYHVSATTIPAPVNIDTVAMSDWEGNYPIYCYVTATINSKNELYLLATEGPGDTLYCYKSTNRGVSWGRSRVSTVPGRIFPNIECGYDDTLHIVTTDRRNYGNTGMIAMYGKSYDGVTWATSSFTAEAVMAHVLLPDKNDTVFMFAQGVPSGVGWGGLIKKVSSDNGATWSSWSLVAPTGTTTGSVYGDPSVALDDNRNIYIQYRSDSLLSGTQDNVWHPRLLKSTDHGSTWSKLDGWEPTAIRCGTKSSLRYQTWYNNGGPIEWSWLQATTTETSTDRPAYYDRYDYAVLSDIPDTGEINYQYASGTSESLFETYGNLSSINDISGSSGSAFSVYGNISAIIDVTGVSNVGFTIYGNIDDANDIYTNIVGRSNSEFATYGNLSSLNDIFGVSNSGFSTYGNLGFDVEPPEITVQPVSDTIIGSGTWSTSIEATGYNLRCAVYYNGVFTGDTGTTYTKTVSIDNDGDSLQWVVWNNADTVGSDVVYIKVFPSNSYVENITSTQPTHLIQYLPLNKSVAYDYSGNGCAGEYVSVTWGPGPLGVGDSAPIFGVGSSVNLYTAALASLFNGNEGSISLLIKPDQTTLDGTNVRGIVKYGADAASNLVGLAFLDTSVYCQWYGGGVPNNIVKPKNHNQQFTAGWMHIGVTWSKSRNIMIFYTHGGISTWITPLQGDWTGSLTAAQTVLSMSGYPWGGQIAHLALWDVELTNAEMERVAGPFNLPSVVCIGTSITDGWGVAAHLSWPNQFGPIIGCRTIVNSGIPATLLQNTIQNTVSTVGGPADNNGRDTWRPRIAYYLPDKVAIEYSFNELRLNDSAITVGKFTNDLSELIDSLTTFGIARNNIYVGSPSYMDTLMYAEVAPWNAGSLEKRKIYEDSIKAVCKRKRVLYAAVFDSMYNRVDRNSLLQSDLVHPNAAGMAVIANAFAGARRIIVNRSTGQISKGLMISH